MKLVIQRVSRATLSIDGNVYSHIDKGLMVLAGVMEGDTEAHARAAAKKLCNMRIFTDDAGKMNLSVKDIGGEIMVVSNFTLGADCRKGNRPSFTASAAPDIAQKLYEYFIEQVKENGIDQPKTGVFGADMQIELINDGPVTIILDSNDLSLQVG